MVTGTEYGHQIWLPEQFLCVADLKLCRQCRQILKMTLYPNCNYSITCFLSTGGTSTGAVVCMYVCL